MAGLLIDLNMVRVAVAPQFFADTSRNLFLEAHMDDTHTAGTGTDLTLLHERLSEHLDIKISGPLGVGSVYSQLKRARQVFPTGTFLRGNPKHVHEMVRLLGLENAKEVGTPSTKELWEPPPEGEEPLPDDMAKTYRSVIGNGIYYAQDREDIQL